MTCANCEECPFRENQAFSLNIHEIHITIKGARVPEFREACFYADVKPVLIAMQDKSYDRFDHLMTSSTFRGSEAEAAIEAQRQERYFAAKGFEVSRVKIETSPNNPIAAEVQVGQYFETHIPITLFKSVAVDEGKLRDVIAMFGRVVGIEPRLSRNAFKDDNETQVRMVTYRDRVSFPKFQVNAAKLVYQLSKTFSVGKVITEFAWFDTNEQLDKNWR